MKEKAPAARLPGQRHVLGYQAAGGGKPFCESMKRNTRLSNTSWTNMILSIWIRRRSPANCQKKMILDFTAHRRGTPDGNAARLSGVFGNPFYAGTGDLEREYRSKVRTKPDLTGTFNNRIKRMDARRRTPKSRNPSSCKHWRSGLLKCPVCGATMTVTAGAHLVRTFQCWKYAKGFHKAPTRSQLPKQSGPSTILR